MMPPSQLFPHAPYNEGRLSFILFGGVQQLRGLLVKSVEVFVVLRDQVTSERFMMDQKMFDSSMPASRFPLHEGPPIVGSVSIIILSELQIVMAGLILGDFGV